MLMLALALALAQPTTTPMGFRLRNAVADAPVALCDAMSAGDKSGNWWCMKGDGTMATGSAVTLVATGTPTNSTENGWPVRTYTTTQNDQEPANAAFPASDFSVCKHQRSNALPNVQLMAFGTSGAVGNFAALPFQQEVTGNLTSYTSDGVSAVGNYTSSSVPLPIVANTWVLLCFTYQRVGGAADNVGRTYVNGVQVGTGSTMRLAQGLSSVWSTNGYAGATGGSASATRGVFVTYKLLSAADIARIYARTAP